MPFIPGGCGFVPNEWPVAPSSEDPSVVLGLLPTILTLGTSLYTNPPSLTAPGATIRRIEGGITIDGRLDEPAWQRAGTVETWYETAPGDNVAPKVETIGYLAYDDRYLYVGFACGDPAPTRIRAPISDRDGLTGNVDHVGILVDSRNDGKTALLFAASASGVQYDSIWDDTVGTDDAAPDFYWDAAAHIGEAGFSVEMRIPFSSLRYTERNPQSWRFLMYRIYPREFWYRLASAPSPRGVDCWVCGANRAGGLHDLPAGGGLVVAPYLRGRRMADLAPSGSGLAPATNSGVVGADVKWTPSASQAFDATVRPDFSQIEADTAQIGANERFALFYPEKRPFFLEGRDLLSSPLQPVFSAATPLQAIYTRTITTPDWGGRATGRFGQAAYTALVADDQGGGTVVIPSATGSVGASQDFRSEVFLGRVRGDFGNSFLSLVTTNRWIENGGRNHVVGPDFQWRPNKNDTVTGEWLLSRSVTPDLPALASEWDGRRLSGYAGQLRWLHKTSRYDWFGDYKDVSEGFRADNGFVPQAGYREGYLESGRTFWPTGVFSRVRFFGLLDRSVDMSGRLLSRQASFGAGFDGARGSAGRVRVAFDRVRAGSFVLPRRQAVFNLFANPSRWLTAVEVSGTAGDAIDFENQRTGSGADLAAFASIQATAHLEFRVNASRRFVNVTDALGADRRLFTAKVDRVRAAYAFTRRALLRIVAQRTETRRDPTLYAAAVAPREAALAISGVFSYKLTWQTVLFLGYGEDRAADDHRGLQPQRRDLFLKVSYAFQH
jgi:Domain of unknown function (DUF5916)